MVTIQQFRSDEILVNEWRSIISSDTFRLVMEIMRDVAPENMPMDRGLSDTDVALLLGDSKGYARFRKYLLEFADRWPMKPTQEKPSYGAKKE